MIKGLIAVALFAVLAGLWPGWRMPEAGSGQAVDPAVFIDQVRQFAAAHDQDGVVEPPPGDVPMLARRFEFWPAVHLQAGQTYRLRLMAEDAVHSVVVAGHEMLLAPGRVQELTVTPQAGDTVELRCNEYCGLGHNRMRLKIY
ncbi:quinol oxidase [Magnetospirillum sulfuroxidans]|uniref:Quinol oxidase n=1 Tax=Magnetospirillum sulfuroxidans TaxID=611300 RepID=A0ABS5IBE0_9PROT|nr:quinol oxidase [Magnetospirillum sulfuroxidans]MBR9971629.1 quinol oxidase [Magnetospirillum sulfuroxidans]